MKKHFYLLLLAFCQSISYGQCDTNYIDKRNNEIYELAFSDPNKAQKQAKELIKKCQTCNYPKGEGLAYIRIGVAYEIKSQFSNAINAYQEGINFSRKHKLISCEASCINNIGLIFWNQKKFKLAIRNFQDAKSIFEKCDKPEYAAAALNNIGLIMEELGEFQKANEYYKVALAKYEKLNLKTSIGYGQTLGNLGDNYSSLNNNKLAKKYLLKAMYIFKTHKNDWNLAQVYANLGSVYWGSNRNESISYFLKSREVSKKIENDYSFAQSTHSAALWYRWNKEIDKAISFEIEALEIAKKVDDVETVADISNELIDLYLLKNNTDEVRKYKAVFDVYSKKLNEYNASMETKRLDVLYSLKDEQLKTKTIKTQLRASELEQQNNRIFYFALIASLLFLVLLTVFYFRRKAFKETIQQQKELFAAKNEERKRISYDLHDLVGSQLSFVVNNLELIQTKHETDTRIQRTYDMSKTAITSLRDTVWSLHAEELTSTSLLERMQNITGKWFDKQQIKVTYSTLLLDPPTQFNSSQTLHVMRIFQESISNIFKHAKATEVNVLFEEIANSCRLVITDNGIGIQKDKIEAFHYGLKSMQERAEKINGILTIEPVEKSSGVQVELVWEK